MSYRPFLSHKREDEPGMRLLKRQLTFRGIGGWQDTVDLRLGARFMRALKLAISDDTDGFIWWGTENALTSRIICKTEIPAALRRNRRSPTYLVTPLFVDINPSAPELRAAIGRRRAKLLTDLNGLPRRPAEPLDEFAARAARKYVRDVVAAHSATLRVCISGGRAPGGDYDLTLDWRDLLDEGRLVDPACLSVILEALRDIRDAAQSRGGVPRIVVDPHLRLPLAALVGWEWNLVRPVDLVVEQGTGPRMTTVETSRGGRSVWPEPHECRPGGTGPHVLAVSVGKPLDGSVRAYADSVGAGATTHLHVELAAGELLDADDIRGLATWTVAKLAAINQTGADKHLLMLGPVSLAMLVGANANGTGRTTIPFWDGSTGYSHPLIIG